MKLNKIKVDLESVPNAVVIHLDSWPIAAGLPDINRFHFIVTVAQKRPTLDHI